LDVVTPVGSNREWRPETTFLSPFCPVLSTAHPVFDRVQNELLTVNYGRSLGSFLSAVPWIAAAEQCPVAIAHWLEAIANLFHLKGPVKAIFKGIVRTSQALLSGVCNLIDRVVPINMADFVYLMRWDGQGDIERWRLVLADGSPVKIRQSLHQICATRNYVVLVDTAFSIGMAEVFNNPLPAEKTLERVLRYLLSSPSAPNSTLYLVRRADLQNGQYPSQSSQEVTVVAQPLALPMEVLHFAVDYDDADDQITLHIGHICAVMAADWLRAFDVRATDGKTPAPPRLNGIGTEIMDVSRLGRYRIDAQSGQVLESKLTFDLQRTWGVEFYTYRDYPGLNAPPQNLSQIYWTTYGFWPEILSNFSIEAFKDYRYRLVPEADLLKSSGIPAGLFRLDTATMTLADSYPDLETDPSNAGLLLNTPQFMPRRSDTSTDPTQGYVVCTAFVGDRTELWIFDAQNLKQGPLCKLGHPRLNFGFTLHSAWLPQIHPRTASYNIPVVEDYQPLVNTKSQTIRDLFAQEIYPHF
ncbi:MAG: carotenoid oxygenase family protein, partial [Thermosynechococcaceae cyanobacterium]